MSETVQANDGAQIPLDSVAQQIFYTGAFVTKITCVYQGQQYEQNFLNDGTNIIFISGWNNTAFPPAEDIMVSETGVAMVAEDNNIMLTE